MKTKMLKLGALLLLSVTSLASCNGESNEFGSVPEGTQIVKVWVNKTMTEPEGQVYENLRQAFNDGGYTTSDGNPIRISMEFKGTNLDTSLATGSFTGDLPDVTAVDCTMFSTYIHSQVLQPIDDYVTQEVRDSYVDSVIDECTIDGKLYGLSGMEAPGGLYVNKKILAQVGYTEADFEQPWSWNDVKDAMVKLYKHDANHSLPYKIALNNNFGGDEGAMYLHSSAVFNAGGDFGTDDHVTEALTSDNSVNGLKQLEQFFTKKDLDAGDTWYYEGSNNKAFEMGEIAFEIHGPWNATTIAEDQYQEGDYYAYNNYAILPYPVYEDANGTKHESVANPCGSYCFGATKKCKNLDAATVVIEYLTGADASMAFFNEIGTMPTNKEVLASDETFTAGPYKQLADNMMNNKHTRPKMTKYNVMRDAFSDLIIYIRNHCDDSDYNLKDEIQAQMRNVDNQ